MAIFYRKSLIDKFLSITIILLLLAGCARLPDNSDRIKSYAVSQLDETEISTRWRKSFQEHPGQSAYYLLADGHDAFAARIILASQASKTIDAQYYLLHKDKVGGIFVDQLLNAADRGVRVRLLVDDMGLEDRDFSFAVIDEHPNVEVRIFNPFGRNTSRVFQFVTGFGKQTRRAHNKSFTVDNVATILGGRNIGNEYFSADPEFHFYDLDILAIGPVVKDASRSFDQFWNHELSYPIARLVEQNPTNDQVREMTAKLDAFIAEQKDSEYIELLRNSSLAQAYNNRSHKFTWGPGVIVKDDPRKLTTDVTDDTYHLSQELAPYLRGVTSELLIFSPYFIPGKTGLAGFKKLRERGVDITILTNSLASTDVSIVHSGYANYRRQLLRMGVLLYELNSHLTKEQKRMRKAGSFYESRSSLHSKAMVIDRSKVFIGSLNLDPRSIEQNTEIGIVLESSEIADQLGLFFDKYIDTVAFRLELREDEDDFEYLVWHGLVDGEEKTLFSEPYTSFWERFSMGLLRLLPAESQL